MAGKFECYTDKACEYRFRLKASNGNNIFQRYVRRFWPGRCARSCQEVFLDQKHCHFSSINQSRLGLEFAYTWFRSQPLSFFNELKRQCQID
jgi:hypothetical protein